VYFCKIFQKEWLFAATFVVGVSLEFEMALEIMCFLVGEENNIL
jgi:hypothetical protein